MKKVFFTMGGKGGTGKTAFAINLVEWFQKEEIEIRLIDLDVENKVKGSLQHFFAEASKVNIQAEGALDRLIDELDNCDVIVADMGASAGAVTFEWFDTMFDAVSEAMQVEFYAIGLVNDDPAATESVLKWADRLQKRVTYLIVENGLNRDATVHYWLNGKQAEQFRKALQPAIIVMETRHNDLENATRNHGVTLGGVHKRKVSIPELHKTSLVLRAHGYQTRLFRELDAIRNLLVP